MTALWLIVEDGAEYLERFRRFGGGELRFIHASSLSAAEAAIAAESPAGLLFDLDFRRTPPAQLIDEHGASAAHLPAAEQRRLAQQQGIYILLALRKRGNALPAVLCADLDDAEQRRYLEETLAPLTIVGSSESLREILHHLRDPDSRK